AGVLHGRKNGAGAWALVNFMRSEAFQSQLPSAMYVYPTLKSVALPESWAKFAPAAKRVVETTVTLEQRTAWFNFYKGLFG
ncbi:MAG: hypothetical protein RL670_55, partial [Actinomycetota bacterium]